MCGIYFNYHRGNAIGVIDHSQLEKRGPDVSNKVEEKDYYAAFYRLAIVGVTDGMQPFMFEDAILLCNGEIYNHKELAEESKITTRSTSDCEIIYWMYKLHGIESTVNQLRGEFAFVLYDMKNGLIHYARDVLGRKPLYVRYHRNHDDYYKVDRVELCSLVSGMEQLDDDRDIRSDRFKNIAHVEPRYIYTYDVKNRSVSEQVYHTFSYCPKISKGDELTVTQLMFDAVKKRICQSERPIGFLLSGGFDSSLVLSMALSLGVLKTPPHVFTIGFEENASDVVAAGKMVQWLKKTYGENCIVWHKVICTIQEGLEKIPEVIKALETYDTTTIRASTPMYLISEYINTHTDVKVILSGEGSDELFGGYLYFKYAPNNQAFRAEVLKLLNNLHYYDVLRADRSTATHGLEIRTPFLDEDLISHVLTMPELKCSADTTKALIRNEIAKSTQPLLPDEILHGKKEAFSDAVGLSWKDAIAKYADEPLTVRINRHEASMYIRPKTSEERYFQELFHRAFDESWSLLKQLWLPNQAWVKTGNEPSARVLPAYQS